MNVSLVSLYEETGCDRGNIRKWISDAGLEPVETKGTAKLYNHDKAIAIIAQHKKGEKIDSNVDPETGLSWFQADLMEKTLSRRRERILQEKKDRLELIPASFHQDALRLVMNRLEQIPGKAKSEQGISDAQMVGLRRLIDDVRVEAAKALENLKPGEEDEA
jgi:hypothetical protein